MADKGRPKAFKTAEEFKETFTNYIKKCEAKKELPNIAGFCVYADINRDTFYAQKEYFSDTYKKVNEMLEDATINSKEINDTFKIFYMKNKFDYRDKQELDAQVDVKTIKVELTDD